MYSLQRKGAPGGIVELSPVLEKIQSLKERLTLNEIKRIVTSGQDPTQLSFYLVKRNLKKKSLSNEGHPLQQKVEMYLNEEAKNPTPANSRTWQLHQCGFWL